MQSGYCLLRYLFFHARLMVSMNAVEIAFALNLSVH